MLLLICSFHVTGISHNIAIAKRVHKLRYETEFGSGVSG